MGDIEERIRARAHELWVEDGMPEGKEAEHWFKASDIVRREIFEETVASPNPAAEAEDFAGVINPDPAARQSEEQVEQRAIDEQTAARNAKTGKNRGKKRSLGASPPPLPGGYKAAGWNGLLS